MSDLGPAFPSFSRREFRCNGKHNCGCDNIDAGTLTILQSVRDHFGVPVEVTSGHRCEAHNRAVGGVSNSQHLHGRAADIKVKGVAPRLVFGYIRREFPSASVAAYATFTHVDTRSEAQWIRP